MQSLLLQTPGVPFSFEGPLTACLRKQRFPASLNTVYRNNAQPALNRVRQ